MADDCLFLSMLTWDVQELIMRHLDLTDLLALSKTGRSAQRLVEDFAQARIRPRVVAFLSQQQLTHAEMEIR